MAYGTVADLTVDQFKDLVREVVVLSWFSLNPTVGFGIKTLFG
jgi:hypothetical protein